MLPCGALVARRSEAAVCRITDEFKRQADVVEAVGRAVA